MKSIALLAAWIASLAFAGAAEAAAAAPRSPSPEQRVAALFSKWNRPGTPGAVVAVMRDGQVLLSKSYGLADLERNVPMTRESVLTAGSMSKQFTAFSIHLLAQDGKLSLDDDIRRYVPEVPDFGKTITIRHLLHHTSGLRDYFNLLLMTGWRGDDVVTQDDALTLVARQRALNFEPGQEYLYCNTGYMLLSVIVQRISGKPLAEFARTRIFEPLGMKHTRFLQGYGSLVPRRALSYVVSPSGGYEYVALGDSADGAGGLVTTVDDLARWDRNFYDGRVGGMGLVARMEATGVLNDGEPIAYASGLFVDSYRGRRMVEHSGMGGGFRAQLARFPEQRLSVAVLANTSDLDIYRIVRDIADIYLERELDPRPVPASPQGKMPKEVALDPARLDALVGFYALTPGSGINFTKEDGRLMAQATGLPKLPVFAYGERTFFSKMIDARFTFDPPDKDGVVAGGTLHRNGLDLPARRIARPAPAEDALKRFEGDFYSEELQVVYSVRSKDGNLVLAHPRGAITLAFSDRGEFSTLSPLGDFAYQCGAEDACTGFTLNNGRARGLQFKRIRPERPSGTAGRKKTRREAWFFGDAADYSAVGASSAVVGSGRSSSST